MNTRHELMMAFKSWMSAHIKPLSIHAENMRVEYEFERDKQIIEGVYHSNIPGSLGGFAVIGGQSYNVLSYCK